MRRREFLRSGLGLGALACLGCQSGLEGLLLPARERPADELDGYTLLARLAHVTDTHLIDEESPARFAGAHVITHSAWRPYEAYSTQLLDGIIRTVNRVHAAGREIDFLLHTGDACDNAQSNESGWLAGLLDGGEVNPLSGPDDRPPDARPAPALDPHAAFIAQGLYRRGVHGDLPSIPWYALLGNHDVYGIGVFPIFADQTGRRTAPLPFDQRPGLVLPVRLDPLASVAHGNVTPAAPGPPCLFETPRPLVPNVERAYFDKGEFATALRSTVSVPSGHGLDLRATDETWYSTSPVPGLRLVGLDTTDAVTKLSGGLYDEGAISRRQLAALAGELEAAQASGEITIVASHHPSVALNPRSGTETQPGEFRALLSRFSNVVLHICGHRHRNLVTDHGSYIEIETCSTLDMPQEGRLVEIWHDPSSAKVAICYEMFSHIDDALPALGADPLRQLREEARAIAGADKLAAARQRRIDPTGRPAAGAPADRFRELIPIP